jgi:ATP-dependent helicase/nuclease subunit A
VLLVYYKSDRVDCDTDLERVCAEAYSVQRLVYALAALRDGAERVDVAHAFLERPHEPVLSRFGAGDRSRLEQEVRELVRGLVEGRFEPTSSPGRELCAGCPGRAAMCSWPPDRTGGPVAGDRPGPRTPPSSASESPAQGRSRGRGSVRPAA